MKSKVQSDVGFQGYRNKQLEVARDQIASLNDRLKLKEENLAEMKIKIESVERLKQDLHEKYQEDVKIFERKIQSIRNEKNETNRNIVRSSSVSSSFHTCVFRTSLCVIQQSHLIVKIRK